MPQTEGDGYVVAFLVIEEECLLGKDILERNIFHFKSAQEVKDHLRMREEEERQGLENPGANFFMLIQPHDNTKKEQAEGFWHFSHVEQTVYRGMPCKYCKKRDWDTKPINPNIKSFTCADCNDAE